MSEFKAKLNIFTGQLQLVPTNIVLAFKSGVTEYNNLPLTGNAKGDARIANDTGHLYVWSIDATSGVLTDWIDSGDMVDVTWDSISGKPSSAVADIDNAVSIRHTQDTDKYLTTPITNILYVDNTRIDVYIPDGSITKPFLTIQSAIDAITNGGRIIIGGGLYSENITITDKYISLVGQNFMYNTGIPLTGGLITITDSHVFIKDMCINGGMTMGIRVVGDTSRLVMDNCNINSLIECAGEFVGNHLKFEFGKLKITGTAGYLVSILNDSNIFLNGDQIAIELTGTDHLQIANTTIVGYNTLTTGLVYINGSGQVQIRDTTVNNSLGTKAIVLNSAAGVGLYDVVTVGDVDCNTVTTLIEGLFQLSGTLTGSVIIYRPASKLTNDSSVTGTTVKDALDNLDTEKTTLTDVKSDSDIADAISKKHSQNTDTGTSGNFDIVGEISIKVYSQGTEPTLGQDNRIAIWINTSDSNRVYLLFRRGTGDSVVVELL